MDVDTAISRVQHTADDTRFSGVVRIDADGESFELVRGFADRAAEVPLHPDTRMGVASVTKGLTGLAVLALVERDVVRLDTTARSLLGAALPLLDERVTIGHLLSHRSGIADYIDESADDITTEYLPVPVHRLATTEDYLPLLAGCVQRAAPGAEFEYSNAGFVILAALAERATGTTFPELVDELVCRPAGMTRTAFDRSDERAGDVAVGYLHADGLRSNVLHLPVRGSGDGGVVTCEPDLRALWAAWMGGAVVSPVMVERMTTPHGATASGWRYGLGCWLAKQTDVVELEGHDVGASAWTAHRPSTGATATVLSNTSEGAWPLVEILRAAIDA